MELLIEALNQIAASSEDDASREIAQTALMEFAESQTGEIIDDLSRYTPEEMAEMNAHARRLYAGRSSS